MADVTQVLNAIEKGGTRAIDRVDYINTMSFFHHYYVDIELDKKC